MNKRANKLSTLVSFASTTMVSSALGVIPIITPGTITYDADMFCLLNFKAYWYIILIISVTCIALIVIMVCNIGVIYIVQKNIKEVYKTRKSLCSMENWKSHIQDLSQRVSNEHHKKTASYIPCFWWLILSNAIAWFPIMLLYALAILKVNLSLWFFSLTDILFLSQVAVHPILETTLIVDVKEPLKEMVTCGLLKKKKDDLDKSIEETSSYFLCCRSADVYGDDDCSCSFILKLLEAAELPKDISSSSRASTR